MWEEEIEPVSSNLLAQNPEGIPEGGEGTMRHFYCWQCRPNKGKSACGEAWPWTAAPGKWLSCGSEGPEGADSVCGVDARASGERTAILK